jgi:glycosyltransferase involved in cell wall biosynthesis
MKTGIIIPVFNRPQYVKQCFESLALAFYSHEVEFYVVNDGSSDPTIPIIVNEFKAQDFKVFIYNHPRNFGVSKAILTGLNEAIKNGCTFLMILDSDAIVKPNFFEVLFDLKLRFLDKIVSGFNTQTVDSKTLQIRHKTIDSFGDYITKKTIGGINMVFNLPQFQTIVFPALKSSGHWDWNVCSRSKPPFIVSKPSVVQHIGIEEGKHLKNPDIAFDFDE